MGGRQTEAERRSHSRADLPVTAVLFRKNATVGRFVVQNLSAGGALLTGRHEVEVDERVRVVLPLPGREPIVVDGTVVRRGAATAGVVALGVVFRNVSPAAEDAIQESLLTVMDRVDAAELPAVLVVQDDEVQAERLIQDLEALGRRVLAARTPLDAVRWLEDPKENVHAAIVDVCVSEADGLELVSFLHEEHPEIRRVLMQGAVRPSAVELMQVSSFVHAVLLDPWDPDTLEDVLRV